MKRALPVPTEADMFGSTLYGDSFSDEQVAVWFADEAEAYASMFTDRNDTYSANYVQALMHHGYRHLPPRRWLHVVGFGSATGGELCPVAVTADRVTIIESSTEYENDAGLADIVVDRLMANPTGSINLPDNSVDLFVCSAVLHHIPNVSKVLSEIARVVEPQGYVIVTEPIISMGKDWTKPRPGLTPHERGIPYAILLDRAAAAGFTIRHTGFQGFPLTHMLWHKVPSLRPYNSAFWTWLDATICWALRPMIRYQTTRRWQEFRPTSATFVLQKTS